MDAIRKNLLVHDINLKIKWKIIEASKKRKSSRILLSTDLNCTSSSLIEPYSQTDRGAPFSSINSKIEHIRRQTWFWPEQQGNQNYGTEPPIPFTSPKFILTFDAWISWKYFPNCRIPLSKFLHSSSLQILIEVVGWAPPIWRLLKASSQLLPHWSSMCNACSSSRKFFPPGGMRLAAPLELASAANFWR